jgi:hypothetical protein
VDRDLEPLRRSLAGRFEVGDVAGAGGMGEVFAGLGADGGRVAIKLLSRASVSDVKRFVRESELLEQLQHPRIVRYIEHGATSSGEHYLVTEWLEGETLSARLRRGRLAIDEVVALGRGVAEGLIAAHDAGLIHRDLKPSNLVLVDGRADRVELVDFGIARAIDDGDGERMTETGEIVGTPGFLSPEQARGVRQLDGRSDLFGLGCVLYEATTGRAAFGAEDLVTTLALVLLHAPTPIVELRPDVPPRLIAVIDRLLEKEPSDRPATAREVLAELEAIATALEAGDDASLAAPVVDRPPPASIEATAPTVRATPRARSRRRWLVLGGLAALAGTGVSLAAWPDADARRDPCTVNDRRGCEAMCKHGDADSCWLYGRDLINTRDLPKRDPPTGIRAMVRGCDLGSSMACNGAALAMRGQIRDGDLSYTPAEIERVWARSCDLDYDRGCLYFAEALASGEYLALDEARALGLFEKACRLGTRSACLEATQRIARGAGTAPDKERARAFLADACRRKVPDTCDPMPELE